MRKRRRGYMPIQVYSAAAIEKLRTLSITNIYSPLVFNNLKYLTAAAQFTPQAIQEIERFISADLFLPDQRTAGNLDTPYGTEVLSNTDFENQTGGNVDNWTKSGMTEDSYSTTAPYSNVGHAVVVDDNAAAEEYIRQTISLSLNTPYIFTGWLRTDAGALNTHGVQLTSLTALYDNGNSLTAFSATTTYSKFAKRFKVTTDGDGFCDFRWNIAANIGTLYWDVVSLRPIVLAAFPNYTFSTADGATGDQYGSYTMAMSDGGIKIYKGPLAGASTINDITYTKTLTGLTIGQTYTVVATVMSDGTGTGKIYMLNPLLLNGGFETDGGGGADVFANWTEGTVGASTVNKDVAVFFEGAASCRLDIDVDNNSAYVYQTLVATNAYQYRSKMVHKESVAGKTAYSTISRSDFSRYWNFTTDAWQDAEASLIPANSTVWQTIEEIITSEATIGITILLGRSSAISSSIYYDVMAFDHILGSADILATDTVLTKKTFTFTAEATSHVLEIQSKTPSGAITIKGISVR